MCLFFVIAKEKINKLRGMCRLTKSRIVAKLCNSIGNFYYNFSSFFIVKILGYPILENSYHH